MTAEPRSASGAAPEVTEPAELRVMTADELRALPYGSAVLTSGHIVWVKYAMHDSDEAAFEWGRGGQTDGSCKYRDSDWLARVKCVPLYTYAWPCDGSDGHDKSD